MPEVGRFLSEDPHPGNLDLPSTSINKFVYVDNNPQNLIDPKGEFPWAIFIAFGLIQGFTNYNQAIEAGYDEEKAWTSFAFGFLAGGTSSVAGGGPVSVALQIFGISTLHNAINQQIFTGKVNIGQALTTGATSGIAAVAGLQIASKFKALDTAFVTGTSSWFSNGGQYLFNSANTQSGIPRKCDSLGEEGAITIHDNGASRQVCY